MIQRSLPAALLLFTLLCTCVRAPFLNAQSGPNTGRVSGQLIDADNNEPIGFANIAVYTVEDGKLVGGATTDFDGKFTVDGLDYGNYRVEASFLGYETQERSVALNAGARVVELEAIDLTTGGATDLDEIVVTAERAVMELGLDRKSFNVEKSMAASGGSAEDLLRQIPSVTVDVEGNVSLRGSGNVRFLINGKPSGLVGDDPAAFLKSLTASNIERVEVITNPGAAFDPEGTAGLINIVLKQKRDDGFNATVAANVGTNDKFDGSLDLNWRKGKFNTFAGVSGRSDQRFFRGFREQTGSIGDSTFSRFFDFNGDRLREGLRARLGTEYALTKRASIGLQGNYQLESGESNNLRTTDFFDSFGTLDRRSLREEFEPEEESGYEVQATYNQTFKTEGRRLTGSVQYSSEDEEEIENYFETIRDGEGAFLAEVNQRAPSLENQSQFLGQLDYTQAIGDLKFDAGWRTTLQGIRTDAGFEDAASGTLTRIDSLSNLFDYQEDVHALYATLGGEVGDWTFSGGLRAEQAYTTSTLLEPNLQVFENDYFKVYPSVFIGYAFDDNTTTQVSYSRRVNRPRSWALNPFVDRGDPFNLRSGNPFLLPELINSFEANLQQRFGKGTLTTGLYFRQLSDLITRITRVQEGGVQLSTRDNLDRGRDYGLEVILTYRPTEKLDLTLSGNGYKSEVLGSTGDEQIDQNGYQASGNLQASYELPWDVDAQLSYFYRSPGVRPQGEIKTIQSLDIGLRKDILDNRGTLTLRATDLFNTRRYRFVTETGGLVTETEFQRESRIVYLGFQYSLREVRGRGRGEERRGGGGGGDDDF